MTVDPDEDALTLLLPFYVNGTLEAEDCARIDAALPRSADLRAELAVACDLAQRVKTEGRAMTDHDGTSDARLQAVLGRLDDKVPPAPSATAPPLAGLAGLLTFLNPARWHPAVALSLVFAVGAQSLGIGKLLGAGHESANQIAALSKQVGDLQFALASGPEAAHRGNIVIQLRPDAAWAGVEALFDKEGLTVTGGPSDGALTLSSDAKGRALDALITRLRASPLIASADNGA